MVSINHCEVKAELSLSVFISGIGSFKTDDFHLSEDILQIIEIPPRLCKCDFNQDCKTFRFLQVYFYYIAIDYLSCLHLKFEKDKSVSKVQQA